MRANGESERERRICRVFCGIGVCSICLCCVDCMNCNRECVERVECGWLEYWYW